MKSITKYILVFILFWVVSCVHAENVRVRILSSKIIKSFIFSPISGSYTIYGDGVLLSDYDPTGIFQMAIEGDSIRLKTFEKNIGKFASLKMVAKETFAAYKVKSIDPASRIRTYDDNLEVCISADKSQLQIINTVDLEKYIAGVVESEAGKNSSLEYYKLQAILCRTYLLAHINRHVVENFEVCDDVHCQAYLSRATEDNDLKAVIETKGLVVVDNELNLITAAFHANCGGETCNSQDVWAISTTYLKSVKDTFCLHETAAKWQRTISLEDWKSYLQVKRNTPLEDSLRNEGTTAFNQQNGRAIFFVDQDLKIPLKTIRADFKLKSTYFSIQPLGDSLKFSGRGYGHGVGLCQEGAMRMAKLKYNYQDILHFYYKDVHLVDLSALNYFKQE